MENNTLNIGNAKILWPNFAGNQTKYSRQGDRFFSVALDPEMAAKLKADGWNVKELPPRDPEEQPLYHMQVKVNYDGKKPPRVYMIVNGKRTLLDKDSIATLDYADLECADLIISPYPWEVNGKKGISAYLKTAYMVIAQDAFAAKYAEEESPTDEGVPF